MVTAERQKKATVSERATVTTIPTENKPIYYPDPSIRVDSLSFRLRVVWVRFYQSTLFRLASVFQSLEGKGRIYEKAYPRHPHLKHRFIPPPKPSNQLPPLILDIHGGGFMIGEPWNDDEPNLYFSSTLNCFVISLNYSKAPAVQFPTPTNEMVSAVLDIFADKSLRFDRSRVIICGYSAGGNLCLSVAQSPLLKGKIQGVISWYPVTDCTLNPDDKARSRPYPPGASADMLRDDYDFLLKAYAPVDALRDPGFSVTFTPRNLLPPKLLIIGAEFDLLCKEAGVMAGKYAGVDVERIWDTDDNQKFAFEAEGIKWICVRGALHGFTHTIGNFGAKGRERTKTAREHYTEVSRWLSEVPFSIRDSDS